MHPRLCDAFVWAAGIAAEREAGLDPHVGEEETLAIRDRLRAARSWSIDDAIMSARRELAEVWDAVVFLRAALVDMRALPGHAAERIILAKLPTWRRSTIRVA